ncbi:DUF805 domain-containing protein [Novosphingobium sp. BL-52-GroH]|uniref:DUF805 domain-containing protein n=1 Tax=Novosphingobium sp. BL-52-GroH TaxID=3349877 RepID=UPI00384C3344
MLDYMLLPFRRYAEFSGRSRRMEFWSFSLLNLIVVMVLMGAAFGSGFSYRALVMGNEAASGIGAVTMILFGLLGLYGLAVLVPTIAVTVRRFHDRDMSGWWYLGFIVLGLIPLVGWIASIAQLVIMFLPGTPGHNRFGADPKDPSGADVFA